MAEIIVVIFVLGYIAVAFEQSLRINKSAAALISGVLCWTVYILFSPDKIKVTEALEQHMGQLSGILFFLLGAMTIVELIDAHDGFDIFTSNIHQKNQRKLLWLISFITFFLSAVLDNLTTTIVMVSLVRKLVRNKEDRLYFVGMIVIAANAGGAWSPIGDVTTSMLWIGGQITSLKIMTKLILPSILSLLIPLILLSFRIKGNVEQININLASKQLVNKKHKTIVFLAGIIVFVLVPVFKTITNLPPYMGMLLGLGLLWLLTEVMHKVKEEKVKHALSVVQAIRKIDIPSILFFLGILVGIAALQSAGILTTTAQWLSTNIKNERTIVVVIGLISSVIDNVPLVAASQGMYNLVQYPVDHTFWLFLAYCAGTGGSILIIGSAAGIAAMGMEEINFFWYLKKFSLPVFIGYFAGVFVYIALHLMCG